MLQSAVEVADAFLTGGLIVYTSGPHRQLRAALQRRPGRSQRQGSAGGADQRWQRRRRKSSPVPCGTRTARS
ncbi:hypothetical protein ACPA9J_20480 [Pseudomonas aeruginosa]